MFEHAAFFKRIIRAVVGKDEKVELIERPLSQVAYKNPRLSRKIKARLGSVRVDVQAEGASKLFSLDMQLKYNESVILKRTVFYSFRMYTSQVVKSMRYDKLKPACVTFIMSESSGINKKYEKQRLTVVNETTGQKHFDILDSYLIFVPNVLRDSKKKNEDLYVFSSFFAIASQKDADAFERDYGAKLLGKGLILLYGNAVANKKRLLDIRQYNYYFTEKEYERVKMEDDEKQAQERLEHAREILKLQEAEKQAKESEKQAKESEKQAKESEKQAKESEKQAKESEKQAKESEKQAKEFEKQAKESEKQVKEQLLETAAALIMIGMNITAVSEYTKVPVSGIEDYIAGKSKDNI